MIEICYKENKKLLAQSEENGIEEEVKIIKRLDDV